MLREAYDWLTTPAHSQARWSGHLAEFVAIAARRRRHRAAWAGHEARSRAAVERAAAAADPDGTALVLGAGHVFDVPLAALSARFRRVVLADLAFSRATLGQAGRLGNVDCRRLDLTGSLATLPAVAEPTAFLDDPGIRFVASVNLVSQLAIVPGRRHEEEAADGLGRRLADAHLRWLKAFACPACLVCDRAVEVLDGDGAVIGGFDPLKGAFPPPADEEWIWDIAPLGEIDRRHAVRHRVGATDDLNRPAERVVDR